MVFKVRDKDSREVFAAKFVRCRKQEEREKCKEEINIMNGLDHTRLLQLAAAYENPREVIMIMVRVFCTVFLGMCKKFSLKTS